MSKSPFTVSSAPLSRLDHAQHYFHNLASSQTCCLVLFAWIWTMLLSFKPRTTAIVDRNWRILPPQFRYEWKPCHDDRVDKGIHLSAIPCLPSSTLHAVSFSRSFWESRWIYFSLPLLI